MLQDLLAAAVTIVQLVVFIFALFAITCRIKFALGGARSTKTKEITFIHPDLGIGGAERLILDAAVAFKRRGHRVRIVTPFFDAERCFPEAKELEVIVAGSSIVPRHVAGKAHVLCASLRMLFAAVWCCWSQSHTDMFFVDQVSLAMVPLRLFSPRPVLFYCHFPDQLCDATREGPRSLVRRAYRFVFDSIEAGTMHFASKIVCNSEFTLGITLDTFPSLANVLPRKPSSVVYPPVTLDSLLNGECDSDKQLADIADSDTNFALLSINRYERKKNLALAIEAFALFKKQNASKNGKVTLVMAGGYDERLAENRDYFAELCDLAATLGVKDDVIFLRSIADSTKRQLLRKVASVVLYTPTNEHFGIVPVEAMACGVPVVAVNHGGPCESVGTDKTKSGGILTDPTPEKFAAAIAELHALGREKRASVKGTLGKARVKAHFTLDAFGDALCKILGELSRLAAI